MKMMALILVSFMTLNSYAQSKKTEIEKAQETAKNATAATVPSLLITYAEAKAYIRHSNGLLDDSFNKISGEGEVLSSAKRANLMRKAGKSLGITSFFAILTGLLGGVSATSWVEAESLKSQAHSTEFINDSRESGKVAINEKKIVGKSTLTSFTCEEQ